MCRIIALDVATKTGVAILDGENITVYYIEGSPVFQIRKILQEITNNTEIVVEDFSYFNYRNPATTAQLNQRLGYIVFRLEEDDLKVSRYNVNTVRKYLGVSGSRKTGEQKKLLNHLMRQHTGLKLTTDESDAIALLMYNIRIQFSDLHKYILTKKKRLKE